MLKLPECNPELLAGIFCLEQLLEAENKGAYDSKHRMSAGWGWWGQKLAQFQSLLKEWWGTGECVWTVSGVRGGEVKLHSGKDSSWAPGRPGHSHWHVPSCLACPSGNRKAPGFWENLWLHSETFWAKLPFFFLTWQFCSCIKPTDSLMGRIVLKINIVIRRLWGNEETEMKFWCKSGETASDSQIRSERPRPT